MVKRKFDPESTVRGSGRTTAQLLAGPDEFYFVINSEKSYVQRLVDEHIPDKKVRLVTYDRVYPYLCGVNVPIIADHHALAYLSFEAQDFLRYHNDRYLNRRVSSPGTGT